MQAKGVESAIARCLVKVECPDTFNDSFKECLAKIVHHREAFGAAHAGTFRLFVSSFQGHVAAPVAAGDKVAGSRIIGLPQRARNCLS